MFQKSCMVGVSMCYSACLSSILLISTLCLPFHLSYRLLCDSQFSGSGPSYKLLCYSFWLEVMEILILILGELTEVTEWKRLRLIKLWLNLSCKSSNQYVLVLMFISFLSYLILISWYPCNEWINYSFSRTC